MGSNGFSPIQNLDELTKAGFTDEQARAVLRTVPQDSASRTDIEHAATELKRDIKELDGKIKTTKAELKRDIKELDGKIETTKAQLKRDIEGIRAELKKDIAELGSNLTFRMVCVVGVAVGFLGTMMAAFRFLVQQPLP